jgi:hypothetical protein
LIRSSQNVPLKLSEIRFWTGRHGSMIDEVEPYRLFPVVPAGRDRIGHTRVLNSGYPEEGATT